MASSSSTSLACGRERYARYARSPERGSPRAATCLSRFPSPQLPPLPRRTGRLAGRDVAAVRGAVVARLSVDRLGVPARPDRLRRPGPRLLPGPDRRRAGRPPRSPPAAGLDAGHVGPARGRARRADAVGARHDRAGPRRGRSARHRQRLRHPDPPVLRRGDGRPRGPAERDRPQLLGRERGAHPGTGARGRPGRGHRRGLLLPAECRQLRGRDRRAAVDAPRGAAAGARASCRRCARSRTPSASCGRTRSCARCSSCSGS